LKGRYLLNKDFIEKLHKYKSGLIDKLMRDELIRDIKRERIYEGFERERGVRLDAAYRGVLDYILDNELNRFSVTEIARLSGIPEDTIRAALLKSVKIGILESSVENRYLLSEEFINRLHDSRDIDESIKIIDDSGRNELILHLKREDLYDRLKEEKKIELSAKFREILDVILDNELNGFSSRKIADRSGILEATVDSAFHDFVDEDVGILIKHVEGHYLLDEDFIGMLHDFKVIDDLRKAELILHLRRDELYDRLKEEKKIGLYARYREILNVVLDKELPEFSPKYIAGLLGINRGTVTDALRIMWNAKILTKKRHGTYSLSDEFRFELDNISAGVIKEAEEKKKRREAEEEKKHREAEERARRVISVADEVLGILEAGAKKPIYVVSIKELEDSGLDAADLKPRDIEGELKRTEKIVDLGEKTSRKIVIYDEEEYSRHKEILAGMEETPTDKVIRNSIIFNRFWVIPTRSMLRDGDLKKINKNLKDIYEQHHRRAIARRIEINPANMRKSIYLFERYLIIADTDTLKWTEKEIDENLRNRFLNPEKIGRMV
ncbi:MAG: hypothetical protein KAU03_02330, partial [Candidatus Altiarchaeales archaeon]|nr:hypothetical protein [Candidatus Altiarchaeales archaeon]